MTISFNTTLPAILPDKAQTPKPADRIRHQAQQDIVDIQFGWRSEKEKRARRIRRGLNNIPRSYEQPTLQQVLRGIEVLTNRFGGIPPTDAQVEAYFLAEDSEHRLFRLKKIKNTHSRIPKINVPALALQKK